MNLDYVATFYWAATFKSITDAAKKMHITPQSASYRITILEQTLKQPLMDRQERVFRLTRAGEKFLSEARRLLDIWQRIQGEHGLHADVPSALHVGAMESVLHVWLIPWLERLRRDWPGIKLEITVETTHALHDLVRRGTIDMVFSAEPLHAESVCTRAFPSLPMIFVGDSTHHTRDAYSLAELAGLGILTFQRSSQPHAQLMHLLRQRQVESANVHAINTVSAMLRLVELGVGVATLPEAAIAELPTHSRLKPLRCDTPLLDLPVNASWRADPSSRVIDELVADAHAFVCSRLVEND
jgi:DNA-binding transcriptional LysR family regulator